MTGLDLIATSVADDLGFVALADISRAVGPCEDGAGHRVIGGRMVTVLAARWNLGADRYRETQDTDLGTPPIVIQGHDLVGRLEAQGYTRTEGNRFTKPVTDVPLLVDGRAVTQEAVIDVLVPAYMNRPRANRRVLGSPVG